MSTQNIANDTNLPPYWKVRIWIKGSGTLHVLSRTEPIVESENEAIRSVKLDYISGTEHGDTVGFIDWREVGAITWRFAPPAPESFI
jgi:hypothetical protein